MHFCLKQGLSLKQKLAIWISYLASELSGYPSLHSPSAKVTGMRSHAWCSVGARHRMQDLILAELLLPMKSAGQSKLSSF